LAFAIPEIREDPESRELVACFLPKNNYAAYRKVWSGKPGLPFLIPHLEDLMLAREGKSGRSAPKEMMDILRFVGFLERHKLGIFTQENLCSFFEGEEEEEEEERSWIQRPWEAFRMSCKLVISGTCL